MDNFSIIVPNEKGKVRDNFYGAFLRVLEVLSDGGVSKKALHTVAKLKTTSSFMTLADAMITHFYPPYQSLSVIYNITSVEARIHDDLLPSVPRSRLRQIKREHEELIKRRFDIYWKLLDELAQRTTSLLAGLYKVSFWVPANNVTANVMQMGLGASEAMRNQACDNSAFRQALNYYCHHPEDDKALQQMELAVNGQLNCLCNFSEQLLGMVRGLWYCRPFYVEGCDTVAAHYVTMGEQVESPTCPPLDFMEQLEKADLGLAQSSSVQEKDRPVIDRSPLPTPAPQPIAQRLLEADAQEGWRQLVKKGYCHREDNHYVWTGTMTQFGYMVFFASQHLDFYAPAGDHRILWESFTRLFHISGKVNGAQSAVNKLKNNELSERQRQEVEKFKVIFWRKGRVA